MRSSLDRSTAQPLNRLTARPPRLLDRLNHLNRLDGGRFATLAAVYTGPICVLFSDFETSVCGGRLFQRKFSKKDYPILGSGKNEIILFWELNSKKRIIWNEASSHDSLNLTDRVL